jgi:hypothetical protein
MLSAGKGRKWGENRRFQTKANVAFPASRLKKIPTNNPENYGYPSQ